MIPIKILVRMDDLPWKTNLPRGLNRFSGDGGVVNLKGVRLFSSRKSNLSDQVSSELFRPRHGPDGGCPEPLAAQNFSASNKKFVRKAKWRSGRKPLSLGVSGLRAMIHSEILAIPVKHRSAFCSITTISKALTSSARVSSSTKNSLVRQQFYSLVGTMMVNSGSRPGREVTFSWLLI